MSFGWSTYICIYICIYTGLGSLDAAGDSWQRGVQEALGKRTSVRYVIHAPVTVAVSVKAVNVGRVLQCFFYSLSVFCIFSHRQRHALSVKRDARGQERE